MCASILSGSSESLSEDAPKMLRAKQRRWMDTSCASVADSSEDRTETITDDGMLGLASSSRCAMPRASYMFSRVKLADRRFVVVNRTSAETAACQLNTATQRPVHVYSMLANSFMMIAASPLPATCAQLTTLLARVEYQCLSRPHHHHQCSHVYRVDC